MKVALCDIGLSAVCDIMQRNDQLQLFMASRVSVKDVFKGQTLNELELLHLDSGFYKWFTAMDSKENL